MKLCEKFYYRQYCVFNLSQVVLSEDVSLGLYLSGSAYPGRSSLWEKVIFNRTWRGLLSLCSFLALFITITF